MLPDKEMLCNILGTSKACHLFLMLKKFGRHVGYKTPHFYLQDATFWLGGQLSATNISSGISYLSSNPGILILNNFYYTKNLDD